MRFTVLVVAVTAALAAEAQETPLPQRFSFEQLVTMARAADPSLCSAESAIAQARGELLQSGAFPAIEVEVEAASASSETESGTTLGFRITQPLDLFGRRAARREAFEALVVAEESARDLALLGFRATLRKAYVELLAIDRSLPAAREDLAVARQLEQLVNRRAELGETREVDRLRIQVERLRAEERVEQLELQRAAADRALRLLVGAQLPGSFEVADLDTAPAQSIDALIARATGNHPRIRIAEASVRQQEALLRLARANRLPEPSVGLIHDPELDQTATGIAVGASLPLWGWNRGEIAAARAALERATAERDVAVREVSLDVTEFASASQQLRRRATRLQDELLPRAQETFRIAEIAYRNGETSQLDYLDARRTYVALQQENLEVLRELAEAESRLEQFTAEITR
jgi:cobalt-zinc-cadmium efflux system outer membrane protein